MTLWIDQKYVGIVSIRLDRFKKKSDKLYNFRCCYCGDSQKDKRKARGYLYLNKDKIAYKCWNCGISASLYKFLEHVDPFLASSYKIEKYAQNSSEVIFKKEEVKEEKPGIRRNSLIDIGLTPLSEMNPDSLVMEYIRSRKIPEHRYSDLYYARDMRVLAKLNPEYEGRIFQEERLVIPFYDRLGNLSGVTGRALGNNNKRYIAIRLSDHAMIYGLKYVDTTKVMYILEGAIDSMFVDNAIAVGGSDMKRALNLFPKSQLILVYDNEPRNKEIVKQMERMIYHGYKLVIWPTSWKYKDINQAIIDGVTKDEVMRILYTNAHIDLSLKLAIRDWKKC